MSTMGIVAGVLSLATAAAALAQTASKPVEPDPRTLAFKLPKDIKWRDPADKAGTNQAVLLGDPAKPASTSC